MTAPGTISEVREAIRRGDRSAVEICEQALARITAHDPALHVFNTVTAERARERAAALDRDPARKATLPLAGVPVAVKDVICTRGISSSASSSTSRAGSAGGLRSRGSSFMSPMTHQMLEVRATGGGAVGTTSRARGCHDRSHAG